MEFILTPEQIGELASDGSITKHPEQDIFGQPYERVNASRKQLVLGGKRIFVVIPTGKDSDENTFKLPVSQPALKAKDKADE